MQRGSSVNFQPIKSAGLAVSHASREVQPQYLLPPDKTMGTIVLLDDKGNVASTLEAKLAIASRQAKRQGDYSPLWEGVINLRSPKPGENATLYKKECSTVISNWCDQYQKMTGHKVLRADIHLDEGRLDKETGEILFNAHAHVMCDKTNDLGRVLKINAPTLRKIQDFTAELTGLQRGENSLKTGRKHITHQAYKALAELGRLETRNIKDKLVDEAAANELLVSSVEGLKAQYAADRAALKASGEATQKAYQTLKIAHELALAELAKTKGELKKEVANKERIQKLFEADTPTIIGLKKEVKTMDEYSKKLEADLVASNAKTAQALVDKALAIEAQIASGEKSKALQKTADGYKADAEKLEKIANERGEKIIGLEADKAEMKALADKWAAKAAHYQAAQANGTPGHLIDTTGVTGATKTASQTPFSPSLGNSIAKPTKSLKERLNASWDAFVAWIKGAGGRQEEVTASSSHSGPVVQLDDLHAVQRTGVGKFAIHQLDRLDKLPALDDPKMEIKYQGGVGQVKDGPARTPKAR